MLKTHYDNVIINSMQDLGYNDYCLISGEKLDISDVNSNNVIRLSCGHSFRYDYFLKSLKIQNRNKEGYNKCPYCFSNVGKIPIVITKSRMLRIINRIQKKETKRLLKFKDIEP